MSLQLTEEEQTALAAFAFPADKNVRVKIAGLALCKFPAAQSPTQQSTIRFLRHVRHHELLMKITQMKPDMTEKKTITVKIGPAQNVEISGTTMTPVASHIHTPTPPELSFDKIIDMTADYLHNRRPLRNRIRPGITHPTTLKLNHCAFYTHKETLSTYRFEDVNGDFHPIPPLPPRNFCEILGGYMSYSGSLIISIMNDGIPLTFPLDNFRYEIEFSNSCDTPGCVDEEDFRFMYDIIRERDTPGNVFRLVGAGPAINTGACLPVSEGDS